VTKMYMIHHIALWMNDGAKVAVLEPTSNMPCMAPDVETRALTERVAFRL
jgi:hypothetical protein